jgi:hypothetical protein
MHDTFKVKLSNLIDEKAEKSEIGGDFTVYCIPPSKSSMLGLFKEGYKLQEIQKRIGSNEVSVDDVSEEDLKIIDAASLWNAKVIQACVHVKDEDGNYVPLFASCDEIMKEIPQDIMDELQQVAVAFFSDQTSNMVGGDVAKKLPEPPSSGTPS